MPFKLVDVAADEKAKEFVKSQSGTAVVPQIYVDGKYKGVFSYTVFLYNPNRI